MPYFTVSVFSYKSNSYGSYMIFGKLETARNWIKKFVGDVEGIVSKTSSINVFCEKYISNDCNSIYYIYLNDFQEDKIKYPFGATFTATPKNHAVAPAGYFERTASDYSPIAYKLSELNFKKLKKLK